MSQYLTLHGGKRDCLMCVGFAAADGRPEVDQARRLSIQRSAEAAPGLLSMVVQQFKTDPLAVKIALRWESSEQMCSLTCPSKLPM